ncbi:MAG: hypothetical protein K2N94_15405 [Lachnospiraceae bacterium]|nr:hypothetical protein [Lachnospiraceae bacterium]
MTKKEVCEALRSISNIAVQAQSKEFSKDADYIYFGEILGCRSVAMRLGLDDLAAELDALLDRKQQEETA